MMEMKIVGKKLTIDTELNAGRPSASGKNLTVATTGGFVPIAGTDYRVNLTVIKKA